MVRLSWGNERATRRQGMLADSLLGHVGFRESFLMVVVVQLGGGGMAEARFAVQERLRHPALRRRGGGGRGRHFARYG